MMRVACCGCVVRAIVGSDIANLLFVPWLFTFYKSHLIVILQLRVSRTTTHLRLAKIILHRICTSDNPITLVICRVKGFEYSQG